MGETCGAIPKRGDGSAWCALEAMHRGHHVDQFGSPFNLVEPGTSARSKRTRPRQRAIIRRFVEGR